MKAEQLRKSILQLAIQGKLVPQDPSDEPASVLLERIRAEKHSLIKQGKIKKDKGDSVIFKGDDNCYYEKTGSEVKNITGEIDFDLPDGWAFARINSLFFIQTGASFKKEQATSDFTQTRILRGGNILQGEYRFFENDIFVDSKLIQDSIILKNNDLITPAVTSIENIGKLARIEKDYEDVTAGGFVFIVRPCYNSDIFAKYMLYALQSSYFNKQLKSITKKSGQAFYNLGKERFIQLIIPIPPLNEQVRIVESIEQFTPLIKEYDKLEQRATKLDDEIYDKLKKSILQYAIQGKLVPQDSNDKPAAVLLERIRAEKKAQLGKKYVESYIYKGDDNCYYEKVGSETKNITDEIPFDMPDHWEWIRVGNLFQHNTGKALNSSNTKGTKRQYITTSNLYWDYFKLDSLREMLFTDEEVEKCSLKKNDLLVCEGGDIGRAAIWHNDIPMCIQNHIHRLRAYEAVEVYFYYYAFYLYKYSGLIGGKGIGIQGLSSNALAKLLFPLPPLQEQKRIVEEIKTIFSKIKDEN